MTNKYVGAAKFFANLLKGGKQKTTGTEVISKVTPNVPETKSDKVKRDLKLATQKSKASQAKLDNTIFRIEQQKKRLKDMQTEKRNEGSKKLFEASKGRKQLRFGGSSTRKSNVQKIKETFGPKGNVPNKYKGFSKLPEAVQQKINKKLAKKV
tara:strand:- start:57 stop:515 length:459 start_codon:yes stop_codon:yes gene_type:complete